MRRKFSSIISALSDWYRGPRRRQLAQNALAHCLRDLGIRWPVFLRWRRELDCLGQVNGFRKAEIQIRPGQNQEQTARTVFHEAYHLAQLHKWGDLRPLKHHNPAGDVERAEALAELYAQVTYKEFQKMRRGRKLSPWKPWTWRSGPPARGPSAGAPAPAGRRLDGRRFEPITGYVPYSQWSRLSREQQAELMARVSWNRRA